MGQSTYIRDGFVSAGNAQVSGSLNVTGGITGSLLGTASWATNAVATNAVAGTANYIPKFTSGTAIGNSPIYDASGDILIGTTTSIWATAGRGIIQVNGSSQALVGLTVGSSAAGYIWHTGTDLHHWNNSNGEMLFGTNNTERMRISNSGVVSITGSVIATGDAIIRTAFIGTISTFGDDYTTFSHSNRAGSGDYSFLSDKDGITYINAKTGADIKFRINNLDKAIINASGNVGIGTTTPNAKLDVNGNTVITGSLLVYGSSLVAGYNPTPLEGTIQDGVTSVLGDLASWTTNYYQGDVLYSETAGGTINFGQLCYRTQTNTWALADATSISSTAINMLGICVKSSTSGNPTSILINGFVEIAGYATVSKSGEPQYMATTAGRITRTAPATAGNIVRLIGHTFWASNTNTKIIIRFNPENSWIEL